MRNCILLAFCALVGAAALALGDAPPSRALTATTTQRLTATVRTPAWLAWVDRGPGCQQGCVEGARAAAHVARTGRTLIAWQAAR